ncbi:MAG: toprim domain-containing protein [Burkholderiales bacterium]|jgi:DNA primase catalytic core|nr:toprim domain-containing protein [Burkholderiales bacterium]
MARIPEADIERLKTEVSVERLVEDSGIDLKRSGKDLVGRCPFHEDDTASLVITPAKNLWHCFGCGSGGGPIDWVIKKNGVSFRHAVELLREGLPSLVSGSVKRSTVRTLPPPVAFDADDQALLNQTVDYYHERLRVTPEALAYLESRGLNHPELVTHFKLGVADRTLGLRLPDKRRVSGADIRSRLTRVGLYRESGHEHFNGSLIVPVFDEVGNVVEIYARKLLDNLRAGTPKHLYLPANGERGRGVFNLGALVACKEIILCEALIDALTFWCAGYRNVTAAYGVEGFTDDMLDAMKHHGTQRVLIAFDRDEPGERGTGKVAERLMAEDIECFRIQFPKGMDANDYARTVKPADKALGLLIRKAQWMGKGDAPVRSEVATVVDDELKTSPAFPTRSLSSLAADAGESVTTSATKEKPSEPPAQALPPLPASPMPQAPHDVPVAATDKEITLSLGEGKGARRYRVRGLSKNLAVDVLKVNLMVAQGEAFHVDTLDLYAAKARAAYVAQAAQETGIRDTVLKADLGRVLLVLEGLQDENIQKALQPEPQPKMMEAERAVALALLQSPDLVSRILTDFTACGLVGEETNKFVGYLAAISRKLDKPLGVVIQSSSAAGKSSLMDAVLAFVPDEEKVKYSAMTGQSLFYMGETNLKHKALAIVEEEGASRASYALKLLQSEGELTIASTGKDPQSGNLITQQYRVEGPVALLFTTTARDLDEELMNRCLVLAVDEGREQTRAIHQLQRDRRTLEGLIAKREKEVLVALHQNAQRLLRPLDVLNPFAQYLTFPDQTTRLRRDHEKYLTLIDAIAFLHQHQRSVKTARRGEQVIEYIEATLADIELANCIAHDVLGRSLDELPPQTRRLLVLIDQHISTESQRQNIKRADVRFTRRALREAITWGDTQLKVHLARLVELEYLVAYRDNSRAGSFEYELVYETGTDNTLRFPGLADVEALRHAYDGARSEQSSVRSVSSRPVVGLRSAGGRGGESASEPHETGVSGDNPDDVPKTRVYRTNGKSASYPHSPLAAAGA